LIILGLSFTPRNRIFLSIGMCHSQNKQYKIDMEDTMRFIDCFGMEKIEKKILNFYFIKFLNAKLVLY
jgi:hypothetical protein